MKIKNISFTGSVQVQGNNQNLSEMLSSINTYDWVALPNNSNLDKVDYFIFTHNDLEKIKKISKRTNISFDNFPLFSQMNKDLKARVNRAFQIIKRFNITNSAELKSAIKELNKQ